MRYVTGFVFVLALGTLRMVGCADDEGLRPCVSQGAGCALADGSVGVCGIGGCIRESGPISCKRGAEDNYGWPDGTLCRSQDLREGTCLDGMCGGEDFCEGVVCDDQGNLCGSYPFCNWGGICEFRQVNPCNDWNACTSDDCDPRIGCVNNPRPDGVTCATDVGCCILTGGFGECCTDGACISGFCFPK